MAKGWKQSSYPKGTPCKVVMCIENKEYDGVLIDQFPCGRIPRLLISDGRRVFGYECWWIPVNELQE